MTFEEAEAALTSLGIRTGREQEYRGKPPEREPHPLKVFTTIELPLNAEDWCSLVMSEGEHYVGGCCAAMSTTQDLIENVFRHGSGWVTAEELAEIADLMAQHDEDPDTRVPFTEEPPDLLKDATEHWEDFTPWDRIAFCWHMIKGHYAPKIPTAYARNDVYSAISTLVGGLRFIQWEHLFRQKDNPQERGNRLFALARILPALKTLTEDLNELDPGAFEGFALIDKTDGKDDIAHNGRGLCILESQEEVDKLLDLWRRQQAEYEEQERLDIDKVISVRKVRVSMENGVEFT